MHDEYQELKASRAELDERERELEAEAIAILRHRPTFFALKLIFGIGHKAKEEKQEPEIQEEATPAPISA